MFKLESFALPLLANYLNKYIRDLKADDLQLSLWKGEVVLNNLELRLDAIEEDLGIPFTFVSGNIQELRIKVPWTRLTTEPVIVTVNTMECIVKLTPVAGGEQESQEQKDVGIGILHKLEKKPSLQPTSSVLPPAGYMESLTTRVLNNIRINFSNLILRYVEDDFVLTALLKSADFFTVNESWEKSFVEVSQSDLCLRKILLIHDLHLSSNKVGASPSEIMPLVEKTFITCRFMTNFESTDCRVVLSSAINLLCEDLHVGIRDVQIPMVRRLVDLFMAYQAGLFRSRVPGHVHPRRDPESRNSEDDFFEVVNPTSAVPSSWTSWALSFIPSVPADIEKELVPNGDNSATSVNLPARANTFAVYARKMHVTLLQTLIPGSAHKANFNRSTPLLRLETENVFMYSKSREAKFSNFRAALGLCRLVSLNDCPCGERDVIDAGSLRSILSFTECDNPERLSLLNGSLFGTIDDEKEIMDSRAPFDSFDSYIGSNSESNLLNTHGVCIVDIITVIEPPEDLASMSEAELEYSNLKQNTLLRVIVSPSFLLIDSSSFHRIYYFLNWLWKYNYAPYVKDEDSNVSCLSYSTSSIENLSLLLTYIPSRTMKLTILKPTIVFVPPSHASMPLSHQRMKKVIRSTPQLISKDVPSVVCQADRIEFEQTGPLYPQRIIRAVKEAGVSIGDVLRHKCYLHSSLALISVEGSLCMFMPEHPPFRDIHSILLPVNLNFSSSSPVNNLVCEEMWGPSNCSIFSCQAIQLGATIPELLLVHFCLTGLMKDLGSYFEHLTFHTVVRNVFDPAFSKEPVIRVDLKCTKLVLRCSSNNEINGRLGSVELFWVIEDSIGSPVSPFLRDRASFIVNAGHHRGFPGKDGCMRISAYNATFRKLDSLESKEVVYSLNMPATTKITVHANFLQRFLPHLGTAIQYHNDLSYADLFRDATSPAHYSATMLAMKSRYEFIHNKISLEILDPEFDYLSLSIHSGKFSHLQQHLNIISCSYNIRALLINLGRSSRDPVAGIYTQVIQVTQSPYLCLVCQGPISGRIEFEAFGLEESVATYLNGNLTLVPFSIGATTLSSATKVSQKVADLYQTLLDTLKNDEQQHKPVLKRQPQLKVVACQDDLRSCSWRYLQISGSVPDHDTIPDVYQIRFFESEYHQTMTWRYPELRTISSVTVIPVPFQLPVQSIDDKTEIICNLQYLKRPLNVFVDLRSFTLMESRECMFRFPDIVPEEFDRLPISDVWRVKVSYSLQNDSLMSAVEGSHCFPMSVRSLAGCMRMNSGIILGVPSSLHISLEISYLSVGLIHHVPVLPSIPGRSLISGYNYDSSYPADQEFARIKIDKLAIHGRIVGDKESSKILVDSNFWIESDFVNYRFLTSQPLMQSCYISASVSYVTEDKIYLQAKIESKTALVIHCGQNVVHTFSMAALAWKMAQNNHYPSLPIMNHIVICNGTSHVVRIRQYTTDECIFIKPKEMHPYSWRSQHAEQKLQFSVDTYPNHWSEPSSVDLGAKICMFPHHLENDLGLICVVRALNNIQRQVILFTQLMIYNKLHFEVQIQLFIEPESSLNPVVDVAQEILLIPADSTSSTQCIPVKKFRKFKIRQTDGSWSDYFFLDPTENSSVRRIRLADSMPLEVIFTIVTPIAPSGSRWVILSPVFVCKNHLPHPVELKLKQNAVAATFTTSSESTEPLFVNPADDFEISIATSRDSEHQKDLKSVKLNLSSILAGLPIRLVPTSFIELLQNSDTLKKVQKETNRNKTSHTVSENIVAKDHIISFARLIPFADSVVMDIKPNGLNVLNDYIEDLVIYGEDDDLLACIPRSGASILLTFEKGQIRIGLQNEETVYLSDFIALRPSQTAREKMMDCTSMGILLLEGFITVTFWEKRNNRFLIHHLTLTLEEKNSVSTLRICSRFAIVSHFPEVELLWCGFVVPRIHAKMNYPDILATMSSKPVGTSTVALCPFEYIACSNEPIEMDTNRLSDLKTFICLGRLEKKAIRWSFPREILEPKDKKAKIITVVLPDSKMESDYSSELVSCYKLTVIEEMGVNYVLVDKSDTPNLIFFNNCPYALSFGECSQKGISTIEENQNFLPLPVIEPGGVAGYSFPSRDAAFPTILTDAPVYQLRLGRLVKTSSSSEVVVWSSTSVDAFTAVNDRFISIPGICYLKLRFERHSRLTVHIFVDPLSRIGTPLSSTPPLTEPNPCEKLVLHPNSVTFATPPTPLNIGVSCIFQSLMFTLDDEISNPNVIAEVLRLSIDDVSLQFYCDGLSTKTYECAVNIGDLQLDNQLYGSGFFDFPVILTKENPIKNVQSVVNILCKLNPQTLSPENVHISLAPMACFLEDTLALHLLKLVDTFLAPALLVRDKAPDYSELAKRLSEMLKPVLMERIHIAPLDVYLSVHASLKVFVALNQTPLSFGELECYDINSTTSEIWSFISMHYIRGTLLRAGWVIGSMDLLGNPSNLLRALSSGCSDLFLRPFSSLHAGPISFLQGVAEGASSFLTNISAGTISSVTNLAESVSRNLDWASLDDDHILRRMEVKYKYRPEGLTTGLKQGLSGFGMSLLGAVAGLVDQPMQAVMQPSLSNSQLITALMLGVTKGIVGAFSKPVAGAAELVSQTGQGILRGNGLLNFPPRRYVQEPRTALSCPESTLKYIWKVAPLLPNTARTLCVVPAIPVDQDVHMPELLCLFLTDTALFVISSADDEFRQAYSLSKLNIRTCQKTDKKNLVKVTLVIEGDTVEETGDNEVDDVFWRSATFTSEIHVIRAGHSLEAHFVKESYLLEWKDALLFEEVFLVAKSNL